MTATICQKDADLDAIVDALDALLTTCLEEDLKEREARKDEPLEIVWVGDLLKTPQEPRRGGDRPDHP